MFSGNLADGLEPSCFSLPEWGGTHFLLDAVMIHIFNALPAVLDIVCQFFNVFKHTRQIIYFMKYPEALHRIIKPFQLLFDLLLPQENCSFSSCSCHNLHCFLLFDRVGLLLFSASNRHPWDRTTATAFQCDGGGMVKRTGIRNLQLQKRFRQNALILQNLTHVSIRAILRFHHLHTRYHRGDIRTIQERYL